MTRRLGREVLILCAPIAILGAVFAWTAWQKRNRTPHIALAVRFQDVGAPPDSGFGFSPDDTLRFKWLADLRGGPKSNYRFGWNEHIVATTARGKVVVWKLNVPMRGWMTNAVGGSYSSGGVSVQATSAQGLNHCIHSRDAELDGATLPLDTQKLEWRGEMVAIPSDDSEIWQSPLAPGVLENWRRMEGATSWKGARPLRLGRFVVNPILMRKQKSRESVVTSENEVEVEILWRKGNRRALRRLVAFDGKKRRVLWTDSDGLSVYCQSSGIGAYASRETQRWTFDVGVIPAAWGEVALECETVFDLYNRVKPVSNETQLSEQELAQFQRQTGGWRVSRRLVLRPMSATKRAKPTPQQN